MDTLDNLRQRLAERRRQLILDAIKRGDVGVLLQLQEFAGSIGDRPGVTEYNFKHNKMGWK